ncbi:hypothetical protein LCGC14_0576430 [marine sediment metagenome]|uniref:HTH asnC-type domain-containing protein n=1 Tax=marine sediment metagenome TaxID=412755 RepID=A0A0F9RMM6_9ZZZZ|nr:MAG: hypothetical protein Lokiarch_02090 [Candidatus Lokiarchaeum sp. GC14_75]
MDDIDKKIITLIQEDPDMTHSKIAKVIKKSQPTVGIRIKKLRDFRFLKINQELISHFFYALLSTTSFKQYSQLSIHSFSEECILIML